MKLESLTRGEAQGTIGALRGELVEQQPLRRRATAARQAHPQHERERLFELQLAALIAHVAVVLQIETVKLGQLRIILGNRSG